MVMILAEKLGKFAYEIEEECSFDELARWMAWFEYKEELEARERRKAAAKSKRGPTHGHKYR